MTPVAHQPTPPLSEHRRKAPLADYPDRWPGRSFWLVALLFAWLFSSVIFADHNLIYRDAGHFYHPLLKYVRQSWYAGEVPLWNPHENLGEPLAASGTSLVFYPGSVLLLIPIPFDWAYKLFLLSHLLLAAWGAAWLARKYGRSPTAATLAAVAYAASGQVLFQYCNAIYLISSAWLPFAWLAVDRLVTYRSIRAAVALGAVWAAMFLGGDPQMVYNTGLVALLLIWLRRKRPGLVSTRWKRWASSPLALLSLAGLLSLGLAAVQVLPLLQLARRSDRAAADIPQNVYDFAGKVWTGDFNDAGETSWYTALVAKKAQPDTHFSTLYKFSVEPWRFAELIWPNLSGTSLPQSRRWIELIPANHKAFWTASLYLGIVPLLLALARLRFWRGVARIRWISFTLVFATLASLGSFGLGWVAREIAGWWNPDVLKAGDSTFPVGDAFGGWYWFQVMTLPGYSGFHYPGKMFTLATLAISLLAAYGWDDLSLIAFRKRVCKLLLGTATISALLAMGAVVGGPLILTWFKTMPPSELAGPFQAGDAWLRLMWSFAQTSAVGLAAWLILNVASVKPSPPAQASPAKRKAPSPAPLRQTLSARRRRLLLALVMLDLAIAQRTLVWTAPASLSAAAPEMLELIRRDAAQQGWDFYRVYHQNFKYPPDWSNRPHPDRLHELHTLEREALQSRLALPHGLNVIPVIGTFVLLDADLFGDSFTVDPMIPPDFQAAGNAMREASGIAYLLLPPDTKPPIESRWRQLPAPKAVDGVFSVWAAKEPPRRAWLVPAVDVAPPLTLSGVTEIGRKTVDVLERIYRLGGRRAVAIVEAAGDSAARLTPLAVRPGTTATALSEPQTCRVVVSQPSRIEVEVVHDKPAFLVLSDLYDTDWQAELHSPSAPPQPLEIYRTNRIMRGVMLPAGEHRVVFRYRPLAIYLGGFISLTTLLLLGVAAGVARKRAAISRGSR